MGTDLLLHHLLTDNSRKYPDRTAVVFRDESLTYSALETKSNQLAAALWRQGCTQGDRVGVMVNKSIESIISVFGIMKAGAIYVPLDPHAPATRVNRIMARCGVECLITTRKNLDMLCLDQKAPLKLRKAFLTGSPEEARTGQCGDIDCVVWEAAAVLESGDFVPVELSDTSPAYILHTSGSTGTPKGVVISHRNALTFVNMAADFFAIRENDRIANHAPLHFDLSVFDIYGAIKAGATVVIVPEFLSTFPSRLAEYIDQERVTIWNSVSSVLTMLASKGKLERFSFGSLRLVHFSGEIMPAKYLRMLKKYMPKAEFYNIYGQTEANSSLFYRIGDVPANDAWSIPIGKPFPHFDVFAVNDSGTVITNTGEEGELHVLADTVALGYWHDEQRTKERFVPDPRGRFGRVYKTGDLVRLDREGNFIFAGRKDHMIKSRGYRIELGEIEVVLNSHPMIRQAVVIAVPDELIGNRIMATVSLIDEAEFNQKEFIDFCSSALPKYMVPEVIECRSSMPVTPNGKIDRMALAEGFLTKQQGRQYEELKSL